MPEMNSWSQKRVQVMYHTCILDKICQNLRFFIFVGFASFDDPQNDLNDLEKIQPYEFQLDGPLKMPNQQKNQF